MDLINNVKGASIIQDLVVQHVRINNSLCSFLFTKTLLLQRKELAEMQAELTRRVEALCERQKTVELLDKRLIELVEQQTYLETDNPVQFNDLKQTLSLRSEEERKRIEEKKQGLTLNLKRINSVDSPNSCEVNYTLSSVDKTTLSSDTYHTAASDCSPVVNIDYLMSDSGVELRPASRPHEDSDSSSNDDYKV